ncbi:unnamed protein product [Mytilus coruscus]|uniref:Ig-like domain-containing protein n=1 Tax=Mytilus coruscus TaxID=42192 RepID=A0A6J8EV30_MYTCO|nr:unnamed protein product [Mytilus coruscus]
MTYGQEGSTLILTFPFKKIGKIINKCWKKEDYTYMNFNGDFRLKIRNILKADDGIYKCRFDQRIHLIVAKIKFLNQTDDNIIFGQEGTTINISCTAITGYDIGNMSIQQNDMILATSNSDIVTFSLDLKREDNYNEYQCLDAPYVKVIGGVNSVNCIADGFPTTYTFHRWEHISEQGKHIRFLEGFQNGTLILQSHPHQYQANGRYVCIVSNGIPNVNGSMLQQGFGSWNYKGLPLFAPENSNVMHGEFGKSLKLTFQLYSNPIVEEVWMKGDGIDCSENKTIHNLKLSETKLGFEIAFETNMLEPKDFCAYKVWAKNGFGVNFYRFEIRASGYFQYNKMDRNRFIASFSIAAVLLMYIIITHMCYCAKQRQTHTRQRVIHEPERTSYHAYDEITSIMHQDFNIRRLTTEQRETGQNSRHQSSHGNEFVTSSTSIQNAIIDVINTLSRSPVHESPENAVRHDYSSVATIDISSASPNEENVEAERNSGYHNASSTFLDNIDITLQQVQSKNDQVDQTANIERTSLCSTISGESRSVSNCTIYPDVNVDEGYENPYQIVVQVSQDPHQYSEITNRRFEQFDSAPPQSDEH